MMKSRHVFFAAAAALLAFAACKPVEEISVPDIQVTPATLSFGPEVSSQTVTVTATRDWTVSGAPEWMAFDPEKGTASSDAQKVNITVMANPGYNRSADVTFTIGLMKSYVHVDQAGEKGVKDNGKGTAESPFTVEGVKAYIDALENPSAESPEQVYVKGKISSVSEEYSTQFGNGTFYITDEDGTETFYVYRALYLGNKKFSSKDKQIAVGDDVVICGNVYLFGSSSPVYETVANKAYLYSLNGETVPSTPPQTEITEITVEDFISKADESTIYRLTGTVSAFKTGKNNSGKDWMQFNLTDKTGTILVYGFNDGEFEKWAETIKDGGTVTLTGTYQYYEKNKQHEVMNVTIESFEAGQTPPDPPAGTGSGTLDDPYDPAGAAAAVANLTWTSNTDYQKTEKVYVKGKISRIASKGTYGESGDYGNASYWISADGSENNEFQIYRSLYFNGEKYTEGTDIKVGDEVIVYGALMNYKGNTPETVANENWLYSLNGKTDGGSGGETPSGGDGTVTNPYSVPEAINAVKDLTWTSNSDYQKTEKVYVKGKISRIASKGTYGESGDYGNASYWISADGSENNEFQIYRSLYFNGEKYTEGTDIKVGDEVVVYGALMNYKGNTPETVAGENWLYSLNGKTDGGSGDQPSGDAGTLNNPYTPSQAAAAVANLTWTSNTDYQKTEKVYVKGKISRIASKGTYGESGSYGNASYWISADGSENEEFQIYRSLYFNGEKYTEGTDIKVGDEVIVYGALMNYKGNTPETVANENWLYSLNGATEGGGNGGQGQGEGGGGETTGDFSSNVTWTSGSDGAYNDKATVNGTADVAVLKLGTSSKTGTSTLTLPEGSTSLTFYAVSWKGKPSKLVFTVNDKELTVEPAANDGLANSSPYTLTVTDSDKFTISFDAATSVKVETSGSNTRAALFGIQAK